MAYGGYTNGAVFGKDLKDDDPVGSFQLQRESSHDFFDSRKLFANHSIYTKPKPRKNKVAETHISQGYQEVGHNFDKYFASPILSTKASSEDKSLLSDKLDKYFTSQSSTIPICNSNEIVNFGASTSKSPAHYHNNVGKEDSDKYFVSSKTNAKAQQKGKAFVMDLKLNKCFLSENAKIRSDQIVNYGAITSAAHENHHSKRDDGSGKSTETVYKNDKYISSQSITIPIVPSDGIEANISKSPAHYHKSVPTEDSDKANAKAQQKGKAFVMDLRLNKCFLSENAKVRSDQIVNYENYVASNSTAHGNYDSKRDQEIGKSIKSNATELTDVMFDEMDKYFKSQNISIPLAPSKDIANFGASTSKRPARNPNNVSTKNSDKYFVSSKTTSKAQKKVKAYDMGKAKKILRPKLVKTKKKGVKPARMSDLFQNKKDETGPPRSTKEFQWLYDTLYPKLIMAKHPSTIMSLPLKLRTKIFRFLSPAERLYLQPVCRALQFEIRCRAGMIARITDDTTEGPSFMRDIIVETVLLGDFTKPLLHPTRMIYRPENVTELRVCSAITVQTLDGFLGRCSKIKYLNIRAAVYENMGARNTYSAGKVRWRALENIVKYPIILENLIEIAVTLPGSRCVEYLNQIFVVVYGPNLRRLQIDVTGRIESTQTTGIHQRCFSFLRKYKTCDHLMIKTQPKIGTQNWQPTNQVKGQRDDLFTSSIRLTDVILLEVMVNFDSWLSVLANQSRLQTYQVLHLTHWALQRRIIENNSKWLKKVGIHCLLIEQLRRRHTVLDLSVFRPCRHLDELYICIGDPVDPGFSDVINFNKLPRHLKIFALRNASVKSEEISKLAKYPKLMSIGLVNLISPTGYGITLDSLSSLLWMRSIEELAISDGTPNSMRPKNAAANPYVQMLPVVDLLGGRVSAPQHRYNSIHLNNGDRSVWTIDMDDRSDFKYLHVVNN